jgi:hypothetical protein
MTFISATNPAIEELKQDGELPRHILGVIHPNAPNIVHEAFDQFCAAIAAHGIDKVTQLREEEVEFTNGEIVVLKDTHLLLMLTYRKDADVRTMILDLFTSRPEGTTLH